MSCPDRETLSAWFDGEVDAPEIATHAEECRACRSFLGDLGLIRSSVLAERPPLRREVRIDSILRQAFTAAPWWRRRIATPVPVIVLLLLLGLLFIPALFVRKAESASRGEFHDYDPGGRAVMYVRSQGGE
ncbi:MAG TPA: hypothetical protein VLV78_05235 [Thermoanaerobaculia bacterium]|nr:hypothetical protein [Thermoanaerobaculia bacterium]